MNIWDFLILAALLAAVVLGFHRSRKRRASGKGCCGNCSGCCMCGDKTGKAG